MTVRSESPHVSNKRHNPQRCSHFAVTSNKTKQKGNRTKVMSKLNIPSITFLSTTILGCMTQCFHVTYHSLDSQFLVLFAFNSKVTSFQEKKIFICLHCQLCNMPLSYYSIQWIGTRYFYASASRRRRHYVFGLSVRPKSEIPSSHLSPVKIWEDPPQIATKTKWLPSCRKFCVDFKNEKFTKINRVEPFQISHYILGPWEKLLIK